MDKMSKEQAANILDPETSREALRPYIYDPDRRLAVVEEACRVAAKVLRFVSNTEPITIDSSGWTDEEVESIKKMLHECGAIVQIPESILSASPAHIDREEWMAEWKEYTGADAGFHYCSKCKQQAFNYEDGGEVVEVLSDFCPGCARAMTEEGMEELEKRMGVRAY